MPSERAISQMVDVFTDVIDLGGTEERTAIVPNLSVIDAAPTGLTNFIIVQDDRDGDNILAKTVPGVVYANNDKVNVLFIRGAEPIAFQQGSESSSANLWQIVPSTSTDIFYNSGNVGIGKSVAPDASLEILDTAQAQLRLTHTEDTKFVDFTLDTSHDLTITPSSTGQIKLQPTTDSTDFFQVLDADGGIPILNIDTVNEKIVSNHTTAVDFGSSFVPQFQVLGSDASTAAYANARFSATGGGPNYTLAKSRGAVGVNSAVLANDILGQITFKGAEGTSYSNGAAIRATVESGTISATSMPGRLGFFTTPDGSVTITERMRIVDTGEVKIGPGGQPLAQLHIDQPSTTAAIPVALFDQADISEEMFEFATTIGVGNAIEAVGAKTLTITHFIKVTIPGGLTRYFPVGTIA